jgi:predicted nucleotidyltransferase
MPRGTGNLQILAEELQADERSLRRVVEVGAVRCRRPSPRRLEIDETEKSYLRSHWSLLSALRAAFRTEPNVRTAVLFGSLARGTETEDSDLDLLVEMSRDSIADVAQLEARLGQRLGREVQIVRLSEAEAKPPLLHTILQEGRPLLDRDGKWARVDEGRQKVKRQAAKKRSEQSRTARAALYSLGAADTK